LTPRLRDARRSKQDEGSEKQLVPRIVQPLTCCTCSKPTTPRPAIDCEDWGACCASTAEEPPQPSGRTQPAARRPDHSAEERIDQQQHQQRATMSFWLGTLAFLIIQAVVTLSINALGQPGNKGCARGHCSQTSVWDPAGWRRPGGS
jgi:hypothetical protein